MIYQNVNVTKRIIFLHFKVTSYCSRKYILDIREDFSDDRQKVVH